MKVSLEVDGLADVIKSLEKVESKVSIKTIKAAQRYAMKPAIDRAKQLVPHSDDSDGDEYNLRDNIGLRAESKKNRAGNATVMRFGAHRQTLPAGHPSGYKIAGGFNKSAKSGNYASLVNDEKPFLEPAIQSTKTSIVSRFAEKLKQAVSKL